ncbi:MAG TPA: hypothetical protein VF622_12830 [Segetibacter sp.]
MDLKDYELAKAKWNDLINEDEVVEKLRLSKPKLRRLRQQGVIKNFRYLNPSATGNPTRPGKNPVYSLVELVSLFVICLTK